MAHLNAQDLHALVKKIPHGQIASYGQLAKLLGLPHHARHAGFALANTPASIDIAWHRVVNAVGRVSLRRKNWQSGSDDLQRLLLDSEGVVLSAKGHAGRIDLRQYGWKYNAVPTIKNLNPNIDG